MKSGRYLYAGAVLVALVVGLGVWKPAHVKADHDGVPKFRVDRLLAQRAAGSDRL